MNICMDMYVCMYIYMYVCIYVHVYVCMWMCVCNIAEKVLLISLYLLEKNNFSSVDFSMEDFN